jgi:hypothetical protein
MRVFVAWRDQSSLGFLAQKSIDQAQPPAKPVGRSDLIFLGIMKSNVHFCFRHRGEGHDCFYEICALCAGGDHCFHPPVVQVCELSAVNALFGFVGYGPIKVG